MSMNQNQATRPPATRNPRKRKHFSEGDAEQANARVKLRNPRGSLFDLNYNQRHQHIQPSPKATELSELTPLSRPGSNRTSHDDSMVDVYGPPRDPQIDFDISTLSVGDWLADAGSLNSVRFPDPSDFSDEIPNVIVDIPVFLFRPRPPCLLPPHILEFQFDRVLRRYRRFAKLVHDYQRWHGRQVFSLWTTDEIEIAIKREVPALTTAYENRPSIPPRVLNTRFDIVLLTAPLLSHLIERYHIDRGYEYFAFFHEDPRGPRNDPDSNF